VTAFPFVEAVMITGSGVVLCPEFEETMTSGVSRDAASVLRAACPAMEGNAESVNFRSFKETRQFVEGQIKRSGLQRVMTEDCYVDARYGYEDRTITVREQAEIAWPEKGSGH
jgi:hypothetical protein